MWLDGRIDDTTSAGMSTPIDPGMNVLLFSLRGIVHTWNWHGIPLTKDGHTLMLYQYDMLNALI